MVKVAEHGGAFARGRLSPLRWAGSKRWLAPYLYGIYSHSDCERVVELFSGSLSFSFFAEAAECHGNDLNPDLIAFFSELINGREFGWGGLPTKADYYSWREEFNELRLNMSVKASQSRKVVGRRAELFYRLNRTCFNGLCRYNKSGAYNVPIGRPIMPIPSISRETHEYIRNWTFSVGSFESVPLRTSDFVYADPPYDHEPDLGATNGKRGFNAYTEFGFGWDDQVSLAEYLCGVEGAVVASNRATSRILDLYSDLGFSIFLLEGPRKIAANGNRDAVLEMVAVRNMSGSAWMDLDQTTRKR